MQKSKMAGPEAGWGLHRRAGCPAVPEAEHLEDGHLIGSEPVSPPLKCR